MAWSMVGRGGAWKTWAHVTIERRQGATPHGHLARFDRPRVASGNHTPLTQLPSSSIRPRLQQNDWGISRDGVALRCVLGYPCWAKDAGMVATTLERGGAGWSVLQSAQPSRAGVACTHRAAASRWTAPSRSTGGDARIGKIGHSLPNHALGNDEPPDAARRRREAFSAAS